jgi:DNA-binding transcriptional LysR family regulator
MSDINDIKLRQLDLALLTVFSEAMRHRKLTVVADRLGLTQSAISHSLRRLRRAFDDELFMRRPFGVEPTQRALEIAERVERIILLSREVVGAAQTFDPSSSERLFRIAGADQQIVLFAPTLIKSLRREAPSIRLSFLPQTRKDALKALADGELDVAIGVQRAPRGPRAVQ